MASTTIRSALAEMEGIDTDIAPNVEEFYTVTGASIRNMDDYFKFAVIRNPWVRLVSCYKNKIYRVTILEDSFQRYNTITGLKIFYPNMPFDLFVKVISRIPDRLADRHFRSQFCEFSTPGGDPLTDEIIRLENLGDRWRNIAIDRGWPILELPRLNESHSEDYREWFSDGVKKIVHKRYRKDIALSQYKF